MHPPLHYPVSEYDCVPTTLINAVSYLFRTAWISRTAGGSAWGL